MKKKLYLIPIVTSIFIIIVAIIITNFEKDASSIEKKLQGVRISKNSFEVIENVTVTIKGSIDDYNDGFTYAGKLHLNNLNFSDGNNVRVTF